MKFKIVLLTAFVSFYAYSAKAPDKKLDLSDPYAAAKAGNWGQYNEYKALCQTLPKFMITAVTLAAKESTGFHDIDVILEKEAQAIEVSDLDLSVKALALYRKQNNLDKISFESSRRDMNAANITGYGICALEMFKEKKFGKQVAQQPAKKS